METEREEDRVDYYVELYKQLRSKIGNDDAVIALIGEIGKDRRTKEFKFKEKNERVSRATESQIAYLKKLRIDIPENLTKADASRMIDEAQKRRK